MSPTPDNAGRREGARRKAEAHDLFEVVRADLLRRARRAMIALVLTTDEVTADDLRAAIEMPAGVDPTCLGAVPAVLARAGIIRKVGYRPSCRPEAHARAVAVWELAATHKAIAWLQGNPEPAERIEAA